MPAFPRPPFMNGSLAMPPGAIQGVHYVLCDN